MRPLLLLLALGLAISGPVGADSYWPQWRGPLGTGVAPQADPPVSWSESENIRWKVALPGKGHSSPVVWGQRVFATTAVPYGEAAPPRYSGVPGGHDEIPIEQAHQFAVLALDRSSGKTLWQRNLHQALPHEGGHYTASLASHSPVTDGEHLFVFFGSYGLYCLNLDGEVLWEKDFGPMHTLHGHGEGSSPALHGDVVVVNWDHEGDSFVVALDKASGAQRWKVARQQGSSWTTPLIVGHGDETQVIVSGSKYVRGYQLATGQLLWECGGLSRENVVASPVAVDGVVYVGSSYDEQAVLAIRYAGARGNITGSERVLWRRNRGAPYVPSPLLYGNALYFIRHFQGVLTRVEAASGADLPGALRLDGLRHIFASPVGAANRVYITDRDGSTLVLSHDARPQMLAFNRLNDSFSASAALAGGDLFLRGEQNLYCIANQSTTRKEP